MPEEPDEWRSLYQIMPRDVYDRFIRQLRRVALVNGTSTESFDGDDKARTWVGPKVLTWDALTMFLERCDDDSLRV